MLTACSTEYSFALAEYYYGKHRHGNQADAADMMFHARFGKPTLKFLCNHDAMLELVLEEGHYNIDYLKASELSPGNQYEISLI